MTRLLGLLALPLWGAGPAFRDAPAAGANPNGKVPLAAVVRFTTSRPAAARLDVSDGQRRWSLEYPPTRPPRDGLPVIGMRPGRRHEIRVSIRDAAGTTAAPEPLVFTTPPLPADGAEFPPVRINSSQPARMEPGVTVLSVRRRAGRGGAVNAAFSREYGLLLALDAAGEVVWYYRSDARISHFERLRNGNFLFLTEDYRAVEIDLLGNTVAEWYAATRPQGKAAGVPVDTLTFHHAIRELPSGNLLVLGSDLRTIENYYTSEDDPKAPRKAQKVMGDEIVEFTRDGKVVWRWNAFDHIDPFFFGYELMNGYWEVRGFPGALGWTHGNGLYYDARENTVLVSLRKLSAVLKIERPGGNIRWILAEPGGWPEKLRPLLLKPEGKIFWPWYQHAPSLTPAGSVLLYNNATTQARPFRPRIDPEDTFSRASGYAVDERARTVREVWSSEGEGETNVVTFAMGNAEALPKTGNVLVCYGDASLRSALGEGGRGRPYPRVREVTHTTPSAVLFEAVLAGEGQTPAAWALFGAARLPLVQ